MSQRRGGGGGSSVREIAVAEEMVPFSESLDLPSGAVTMDRSVDDPPVAPILSNDTLPVASTAPLTLDDRYEAGTKSSRLQMWKEGHFAAGMTAPTWSEEYQKWRTNFREECTQLDNSPDGAPCLCCSAVVCGALGAGRVGNMAILKQSTEWVETEEVDETGGTRARRFTRPRLEFVVGPYWPMLLFVTYPLIFGVSIATLMTAIPGKHPLIIFFWACCTLTLIVSLALTAFRDPGILPRYTKVPSPSDETWRWNDRAHSYRPRGAWFDPDTGVIVEGFDHTCPWTGTAIGKNNMRPFQTFVGFIFLCLILDICLLTGGIP